MKIKPLVLLIFLALFTKFSLSQDLEICYRQIPGPNDTDTVSIYFRSNADTAILVRAVQFSFALQNGCSDIRILENEFMSLWGTFLEASAKDSNLNLMYNGIAYDARFAYGNADPNMGNGIPLVAPKNSDPGVLGMKLLVSGICRNLLYMENEAENQVNQIGGKDFLRIPYFLISCRAVMGISDQLKSSGISVYPNPVASTLMIEWKNNIESKGEVRVTDAFGSQQYSGTHLFSEPVTLDVSGLPAGVYFVGFHEKKGSLLAISRFVKL